MAEVPTPLFTQFSIVAMCLPFVSGLTEASLGGAQPQLSVRRRHRSVMSISTLHLVCYFVFVFGILSSCFIKVVWFIF